MSKYERLNRLLELLGAEGHLSVEDAARTLHVSPATVRRDLDGLADERLLHRTHGGAVANSTVYDLPLRYKTARHAEQKIRIAQSAAELIPIGSVVGLNGGTTTTEVGRALATRADLHSEEGAVSITVVTNALNIANELAVRRHVKIVVVGGVPRSQSYELVGPLAIPVLNQLTLDFAILGVDAFDMTRGACAHNEEEAEINARIAARALRVLVVADSTKLGRSAFAQIRGPSEVDILVTDSDADPGLVKELTEIGIEVSCV
jgi:DeoR family transcriptional regulator of aga operon